MVDWLLQHDGTHIYILIFLLLIGGAIGLPIPEDLSLLAAGVAIHRANLNPEITFIISYAGVLCGDGIVFGIGRLIGPALFKKEWFQKRVARSKIRYLRYNLEKRAFTMILVARRLFYLRTITFLACGAVKMRPIRFFVADALAALISAPVMILLGYLGSENFGMLTDFLGQAKTWGLAIGIICLGVYIWIKYSVSVHIKDGS